MNVAELPVKAQQLRRDAIEMLYAAQSGHPGSVLSTMDVLVALYYGGILHHDPKQPDLDDRDHFLLSNGHACPGLYAVLADQGYFPKEQLQRLRQLGAPVQGHPHRGALPGIEISSGSLGQGLSVGIGIAAGLKLAGKQNRVYVMMSDGEQEEGSTWEAIMYAPSVALAKAGAMDDKPSVALPKTRVMDGKPKRGLDNLIAIVDKNKFQIDGATSDIMPGLDPLPDKYRAFNWHVQEIDGHNFEEIMAAFEHASAADRPAVIISNTVRGRGVSFMENSEHWHAGAINDEEYRQALEDLA